MSALGRVVCRKMKQRAKSFKAQPFSVSRHTIAQRTRRAVQKNGIRKETIKLKQEKAFHSRDASLTVESHSMLLPGILLFAMAMPLRVVEITVISYRPRNSGLARSLSVGLFNIVACKTSKLEMTR